MSKFNDFLLWQVEHFSDWNYVTSAESSKEEFYKMMVEEVNLDKDITKEKFIEEVKEDWVHFHIRGDQYEEFGNKPVWWLGCEGMKWSKKVWTY